ncbi:hypothetical protein HLB23_18710 [Nocardia uniformis]|uniref:Uncharacterized protein n=1 Tax=Nocardia uniformis TaxID=53432 RepID=A0A849BZ85_9NOCA|nr:hypothetical protein [Nocardia uniformis]NNH71863.1 hypothetical protein [Nocardia uniformis]
MIVYSFEKHLQVADFDPETGALRRFERGELPAGTEPAGYFGELGAKDPAVFYRGTDGLLLRVDDEIIALDDPDAEVHWEQIDPNRAGLLILTPQRTYRLDYPNSLTELRQDPNFGMSGEEPEDFDFGLFISNVLADPNRRTRILPIPTASQPASPPAPTRIALYSYARDLRPEKVAEFTWSPADGVALTVLDAEWGALAWEYFTTGIPAATGPIPASSGQTFMRALLRPSRSTYYRFVDESA